jgi:cell wall-associated NlpC family hydrolase
MLACARRAAVILFVCVGAFALLAPATDAEPRFDPNGPLPVSHITSPVTGTHLVLSPRHTTIKYHHTVRLVSRLTSKFGPVRGETVTWWTRSSHRSWHRLGRAKTNKNGRTAVKRRLANTTQWQVRYDGDLLQNKSASAVTTVKVLPPPRPSPGAAGFAQRVLQEAASHKGAPYQYGAAGPNTFDCSGFTMYVFGRFGVHLSHNAASQYGETRHISSAAKQPGDLIFFTGSGGIYHVGIYSGGGQMWAATHSGDVVRYESIYQASYVVGRVH